MTRINTYRPARLATFNFGIQLVWGAILAVSLQVRCIELSPGSAVNKFALMAALGAAIAALVQVAVGRLSDARAAKTGQRHEFYLVGVAISVPLLLAFFCASDFTAMMLAFFGLQITMNVASGPYQAAIPDHAPLPTHGTTASWMSIFQSLGAATGLVVAGFVTSEPLVGVILSAGLLISFAISYLHIRRLGFVPHPEEIFAYSRSLWTLLISRGLINVGFYILLGFLVFYVRDSMHIHDAAAQRMDAALLFLTFTLTGIIGALLAGKPSDRYDKRTVISLANGLMIIALAALAWSDTFAFAYMAAAIAGISWGAFVTADWALACAVLPRQSVASAMGIWNLASVVPQILAPLLAAPLVVYGNGINMGLGPRFAMLAAAITVFLGTLCIWRIPRLRMATI